MKVQIDKKQLNWTLTEWWKCFRPNYLMKKKNIHRVQLLLKYQHWSIDRSRTRLFTSTIEICKILTWWLNVLLSIDVRWFVPSSRRSVENLIVHGFVSKKKRRMMLKLWTTDENLHIETHGRFSVDCVSDTKMTDANATKRHKNHVMIMLISPSRIR